MSGVQSTELLSTVWSAAAARLRMVTSSLVFANFILQNYRPGDGEWTRVSWKTVPTLLNQGGVKPTHMWFCFPPPRVSYLISLHPFRGEKCKTVPIFTQTLLGVPGMYLQIRVNVWQVTKERGVRSLSGLQAVSLLSRSPIANKWTPVSESCRTLNLTVGCIFWAGLVFHQLLPTVQF